MPVGGGGLVDVGVWEVLVGATGGGEVGATVWEGVGVPVGQAVGAGKLPVLAGLVTGWVGVFLVVCGEGLGLGAGVLVPAGVGVGETGAAAVGGSMT